jgi:hypothetical protein
MRAPLLLGCFLVGCIDVDIVIDDTPDTTAPVIRAISSGLDTLCSDQPGANPCNAPVSPAGVSFTDPIQIFFSEGLDPSTVVNDTAFLVKGPLDDAFLADADSPPLLESRREQLHPVTLTLGPFAGEDNASVLIAPTQPLEKQTLYTLVLSSAIRDTNGAPLVDPLGLANSFPFTFTTGNQGSPIANLIFPAPAEGQAEAQNVPTNVPRAVLLFSQPVLGVVNGGVDQGRIQLIGGDALPVNITLQDGVIANTPECSNSVVSQCFTININEELIANSTQEIQIAAGVTDINGAALVGSTSFRFTTGAGPDDVAPAFLAAPAVIAQDISATLSFTVDEPAVGIVTFQEVGGPTTDIITSVTDLGNGGFLHQVLLAPLDSETNFLFDVAVTDFAGNTATASGGFTTSPPLPKLVISEVMANPQSSSESSEEFVEIFNADVVPIDLNGMIFHRVQNGAAVSNGTLGPRAGGSTVLQPGEFAIIVGSSFAPVSINVSGTAIQMQSSVSLSLSNSTDDGYTLESAGFVLASFTNFLAHDCNGRSIERINNNVGEVATNFAYCDNATGATPGSANSGSTDQNGNICF